MAFATYSEPTSTEGDGSPQRLPHKVAIKVAVHLAGSAQQAAAQPGRLHGRRRQRRRRRWRRRPEAVGACKFLPWRVADGRDPKERSPVPTVHFGGIDIGHEECEEPRYMAFHVCYGDIVYILCKTRLSRYWKCITRSM